MCLCVCGVCVCVSVCLWCVCVCLFVCRVLQDCAQHSNQHIGLDINMSLAQRSCFVYKRLRTWIFFQSYQVVYIVC